ncbi:MAG: hypothetical protein AAF607_02630 [Pseudomonadota bacterium]
MTDANSDMGFEEDFFSPEELAMMNGADGDTEELFVTPSVDDLQAQLQTMALMVDQGCEREQELRVILKGLRAAQADDDSASSAQQQTEALARMVILSCERERALQEKLAELRKLFAGNSAIDR